MKAKKYLVSSSFTVVVAYGDTSGLNESEELSFLNWEQSLPAGSYYVVSDGESMPWGKCEITGVMGDLIEVSVFPNRRPRDTGEDFIYDDQGMPWLFDEA